jgi:sarcosine oxidase
VSPPSAIVVGAGVFGAAAADALARRGWEVTVIDRYGPANARGSSGDRTRMVRVGHGSSSEAEWYMRSALRSLELWRELSAECPESLVAECGLVWLAGAEDELVGDVATGLERVGARHEWLDADALAALFPSLATEDLAGALHEPGACILRATVAVEALLRRARRHGAQLRVCEARPAGAGAVDAAGETLAADAVIWACGAWLGSLFPRGVPVRPAWQDVLHWHCPPEWSEAPAWFDERAGLYGFPDVDGLGLKAVSHLPGREFELDRDERIPDPDAIAHVSDYLGRRFPELRGTGLLHARVMPYEMTPDEHFLAARSDEWDRHWLLGGGSGHGFKHAPVLGEHVADLVEEMAEPLPQFAAGERSVPADQRPDQDSNLGPTP